MVYYGRKDGLLTSAATTLDYSIDASDALTAVGDAWAPFALANDGAALMPAQVLGTPLWRWIADETTRQIYRAILVRVRGGRGPIGFRFRCDAPRERRLLSMEISASQGGTVTFRTHLLESQPRAEVRLIGANANRSDEMLSACGWCMRVQVKVGEWIEVEKAVKVLGLFEMDVVPRITHGICPACSASLMTALDDEEFVSGDVTLGALPVAGS